MTDYAELRAALDQTCHALLIDDPDIIRALLAERDALAAGALKVIEMNRQEAHDRCGDADKAESWSCVRVLRAALAQEQEES